MIQRNVLSDLNRLSAKLATHAEQGVLRQGDHAPVGRSVQRRARDGLRSDARPATSSTSATSTDAQSWQDVDRDRAGLDHRPTSDRAHELLVQGGDRHVRPDGAQRDRRPRSTRSSQGIKETANANVSATATVLRHRDATRRPYAMGADDTYQGDDAGLTRRSRASCARSAPASRCRSTPSADEVLGERPGGRRRQAAQRPARHRRSTCAPTTAPRCAAATSPARRRLDTLLEVRARNGAQTQPPRGRVVAPGPDPGADHVKQLSNTEDADIAKTIIDFNPSSAAYQAALRAGASIVQASLMDFLR